MAQKAMYKCTNVRGIRTVYGPPRYSSEQVTALVIGVSWNISMAFDQLRAQFTVTNKRASILFQKLLKRSALPREQRTSKTAKITKHVW
jgi:hypothetical protein